jgi:hypothetical protein
MQQACLACMQQLNHAVLTGHALYISLLCCTTGVSLAGP